jgi:hypothetical protein
MAVRWVNRTRGTSAAQELMLGNGTETNVGTDLIAILTNMNSSDFQSQE